jgi:hypothetical protein
MDQFKLIEGVVTQGSKPLRHALIGSSFEGNARTLSDLSSIVATIDNKDPSDLI